MNQFDLFANTRAGIDRAAEATSRSQSAGRGHTGEGALRLSSCIEHGLPQPPSPYPEAGAQSGANGQSKGAKPGVGIPKPHKGRGSRQTSREALATHRASGKLGGQQAQIWSLLKRTGQSLTRAEMAKAIESTHGAACARTRELLDLGLLEETARRVCSVTGAMSHGVRAL